MTKIKKYYHQKLVRDKIPQKIEKVKEEYKATTLKKKEIGKFLRRKLIEESTELVNAKKDDLVSELADVLQVIKSIADFEKISFKKIEKERKDKEKKVGAFKKGIFLVWSSKAAGKK